MHHLEIKKGILGALCYADIFDYPLKSREIYKYFVAENRASYKEIILGLSSLSRLNIIDNKGGYYYLYGRKNIVRMREKRKVTARGKIKIAKRITNILAKIPTIKFIGISGSLAVRNADVDDDIDLFFITAKNTLWITRFFVNIVLFVMGEKRSKKDSVGSNKICPNMFLAEDNLVIPKIRQSLFSAREIIQLIPLFDRNDMHKKFIQHNNWISDIIPNSYSGKYQEGVAVRMPFVPRIVGLVNKLFYLVQYIYMMGRITSEEVNLRTARFHPRDYSGYIMDLYKMRYHAVISGRNHDIDKNISKISIDTPGY